MGDVRSIEVRLSSLEDRILDRLGYREFQVFVGSTEILPKPGIIEKPLSSYNATQLQGFADSLGGQGNPITTFKLAISREFPEPIIRNFAYWRLIRDSYEATCLPVDFKITDARALVTVAVIKSVGPPPSWNDSEIWGPE